MADTIAEVTTTATITYSLKDSYKAAMGVLFENGRNPLDRLLPLPGRDSLKASLTQAYHVLRVANSLDLNYQGLDTLLQERIDVITRTKPQVPELNELLELVKDEKRKKEHGEKFDIKDPITESYTEVAKEILSKEFEEDEFNLENKLYDKGDIEQARDYNLRKIREVLAIMNDMGSCYGLLDNNVFYGILELVMGYVPQRGRKPALLYDVEDEMNKGKRFSFWFSSRDGVSIVLPKCAEPIYLGNLTDLRRIDEFRDQLMPLFAQIGAEIELFSNAANNMIKITVADAVRQIASLQLGKSSKADYPANAIDYAEQRIIAMTAEIQKLRESVSAYQNYLRELTEAFGTDVNPTISVKGLLASYLLRQTASLEGRLTAETNRAEELAKDNAELHKQLSASEAREFDPKTISPKDIARIPGDRLAQADIYPKVAYGGKRPVEIRDIIESLKAEVAGLKQNYEDKLKEERDHFEQELKRIGEENTRLNKSVDLLQRQLMVYRNETEPIREEGRREFVKGIIGEELLDDKLSAYDNYKKYVTLQLGKKVDREKLLYEAFGEHSKRYQTINEMLDATVREKTSALERKISEATQEIGQLKGEIAANSQTIDGLQLQLNGLRNKEIKPKGYLDLAEAYDHATKIMKPSDSKTQFTHDPAKFYEWLLGAISDGTIQVKGNRFIDEEQLDGLIAAIQK